MSDWAKAISVVAITAALAVLGCMHPESYQAAVVGGFGALVAGVLLRGKGEAK